MTAPLLAEALRIVARIRNQVCQFRGVFEVSVRIGECGLQCVRQPAKFVALATCRAGLLKQHAWGSPAQSFPQAVTIRKKVSRFSQPARSVKHWQLRN